MNAIAKAQRLISRSKMLVASSKSLISKVRSRREASVERRKAAQGLREDARLLRGESPHALMPLDLAVKLVFRRVYEEPMQTALSAGPGAHLDGLAYVISELMPIFVYQRDGTAVREITKSELAQGLFQDGARRLAYIDGRPAFDNLAVSAKKIDAVIQALRAASNFE